MSRIPAALLAAALILPLAACGERNYVVVSKSHVGPKADPAKKGFYVVMCEEVGNPAHNKSGRVTKTVYDKVETGQTCPTLR